MSAAAVVQKPLELKNIFYLLGGHDLVNRYTLGGTVLVNLDFEQLLYCTVFGEG